MSMISNVPESSDPQDLARRLTILEREVDRLKKRRTTANAGKKWWHAVAGTFDADPVYEAIAAEGKKWRQSQRAPLDLLASTRTEGLAVLILDTDLLSILHRGPAGDRARLLERLDRTETRKSRSQSSALRSKCGAGSR